MGVGQVVAHVPDPALAARRLCALSPPPITRAEWEQHLPGIPPRGPCP
ncbi:hypothetical protein ACFQ08_36200 [Streptosporangium algeriense]|uniref:Uncharacterized protein n=1 Tax=Streptosporangium algeriense TaxID=1682748 RepID=A0ABW3E4L3_9ACTN